MSVPDVWKKTRREAGAIRGGPEARARRPSRRLRAPYAPYARSVPHCAAEVRTYAAYRIAGG
eukprot:826207-Rhodomonas_salina.1